MSFSVNHCIAERSTNAAMAIELLHDDGDYTQRDKTRHLIQYVLTYLIGWQQQYYYFSPFSFSEFIYRCCCYFLLLNCTQMRNIANHLCASFSTLLLILLNFHHSLFKNTITGLFQCLNSKSNDIELVGTAQWSRRTPCNKGIRSILCCAFIHIV